MTEITDPTFYRTPADAIAAEPESLAYVAAFDPSGEAKDAIAVMDCNRSSATYGEVVGWAELPTGGNELHHFGWTACPTVVHIILDGPFDILYINPSDDPKTKLSTS